MNISDIEAKAAQYAVHAHASVNHKYDGNPYRIHLAMVADNVEKFLPTLWEKNRDELLAAAWLHDTIEDCRLTYNDIKSEFGARVAEIVYALTNEKGRTRKDRANDKYYEGIRNTPGATIVKFADRIANAQYSKESGSSMFEKYRSEHEEFVMKLWGSHGHPMIEHLDKIFND